MRQTFPLLLLLAFTTQNYRPAIAQRSRPLVGNGSSQRGPIVGAGAIYSTPKRIRRKPTPLAKKKRRPRTPQRRAVIHYRTKAKHKPIKRRLRARRKPVVAKRSVGRKRRAMPRAKRKYVRQRRRLRPQVSKPRKQRTPRSHPAVSPPIPPVTTAKTQRVIPQQTIHGLTNLLKPMEASMVFPFLEPRKITGAFGWRIHPISKKRRMHNGIDIAAPHGLDVLAAYSGRVIKAGRNGGYGLSILLSHGDGSVQTRYAHCSKLFARRNLLVNQGQIICEVGSTGLSTGPHLHFEKLIRQPDGSYQPVNPADEVNVALVRLTQQRHLAQTRNGR